MARSLLEQFIDKRGFIGDSRSDDYGTAMEVKNGFECLCGFGVICGGEVVLVLVIFW
jgi:hypothetical protein